MPSYPVGKKGTLPLERALIMAAMPAFKACIEGTSTCQYCLYRKERTRTVHRVCTDKSKKNRIIRAFARFNFLTYLLYISRRMNKKGKHAKIEGHINKKKREF